MRTRGLSHSRVLFFLCPVYCVQPIKKQAPYSSSWHLTHISLQYGLGVSHLFIFNQGFKSKINETLSYLPLVKFLKSETIRVKHFSQCLMLPVCAVVIVLIVTARVKNRRGDYSCHTVLWLLLPFGVCHFLFHRDLNALTVHCFLLKFDHYYMHDVMPDFEILTFRISIWS